MGSETSPLYGISVKFESYEMGISILSLGTFGSDPDQEYIYIIYVIESETLRKTAAETLPSLMLIKNIYTFMVSETLPPTSRSEIFLLHVTDPERFLLPVTYFQIKNIHTLWGWKRFLLPFTTFRRI